MKPKYAIMLAVLSGVLTGLSFPTRFGPVMMPNLGFLAWFSLVPIFVVVSKVGFKQTILYSFIAGFVYHTVSLFWIYPALTEYGGLSPLISVIMLITMMTMFGVYFAIIPAWAKWAAARIKLPMIVLLPVAYVAVEFARNYFPFGGFPWNNIAYSQFKYLPVIQMSDLFGVYGVTFVLVFVNSYIAEIVMSLICHPGLRAGIPQAQGIPAFAGMTKQLVIKSVIFLLLLSFTFGYGYYKLETTTIRSNDIQKARVALIQANIPQDEKWDEEFIQQNLDVYRDYMRWTKNGGASLVIWPESAFPYLVPLEETKIDPRLLGLSPAKDAPWLLFGALSLKNLELEQMYNSALLVDDKGTIMDRYHKGHLVPFGEYVPLRKLFFFAKKLVSIVGDFERGEGYRPVIVKDYAVGPLICYEDVFPEISRNLTVNGANILTTITNDAWYGWTSSAYQHLAISAFRAVENRRFMLRAANTGVSAVIDPTGKIEIESSLFTKSLMATSISILNKLTIYDRIGDLFASIAAVLVLVVTAIVFGMRIICRKNC